MCAGIMAILAEAQIPAALRRGAIIVAIIVVAMNLYINVVAINVIVAIKVVAINVVAVAHLDAGDVLLDCT